MYVRGYGGMILSFINKINGRCIIKLDTEKAIDYNGCYDCITRA